MRRTRDPRPESPPGADWAWYAFLVTWLWPVGVVASLYFTWIVAWIVLGHRPVPSIDDPKSIGPVVDSALYLTYAFMISLPFMLPLALVSGVWYMATRRTRQRTEGASHAFAAIAAISFGSIAVLCGDPLKVGYWFMD